MKKFILSLIGAGLLTVSSMCVSLNAKACEYLEYTCVSDGGAWLRTEPCVSEDNKIGVIPKDAVISINNIVSGWGQVSYTFDNGEEVIGYTALDLYEPLILDDNGMFIVEPSVADKYKYGSQIYTYLTGVLGFNSAQADGVLANMVFESKLNPNASVIDTNGELSYGICQWNASRFDNLVSFCEVRDLDYTTIEAQLGYLRYELEGSYNDRYNMMLSFENSATGAYESGYYWASRFEVCASEYWDSRGQYAWDIYVS